ncbi:type III secretion system (T3SS) SseB-like protein [Frigoribacterium sp. PhB107]|uniref:SseB family protein n=1 Tax=Frigoribacterium sp. PhB107 TaxID=2485172 RepID=UPI000F46CCC4|nr:SseB family protein [Frigoribacterium sp. PhB107]ROP73129.1 type III secretion system (T3SS) SseB-like protein [Frigoribacterium sp. PhB107]
MTADRGPTHAADSAGRPFAGRTFEHHDTAHAGDDGSADPRLLEALVRFGAGGLPEHEVVDALRPARLLIPLVAVAGEEGLDDLGRRVDKTQELSIVTVAGPDGRAVLPAFTSVEALSRWDAAARPVPVDARRVALAAVAESTEHLVLDPGSPTEFGVRRPALWAVAQDLPWVPAHADEAVLQAFLAASTDEEALVGLAISPGYRGARLGTPEIVVRLAVRAGLDQGQLGELLQRLQASWQADPLILDRVDSMSVSVVPA